MWESRKIISEVCGIFSRGREIVEIDANLDPIISKMSRISLILNNITSYPLILLQYQICFYFLNFLILL